ncbi:ComEC/Rec2 family competence protein [Kaistia algarum]|uniref:ComEC/Rec2 family competence protein n=1 Tax=Kaistia algarum TaxID=2083279 RepID=UPI00225173AC|nr:ComEC/Rec2 family competence protein [Kaistia algarum]MCX5514574.1 ComEC/Rec2 family competence protein [Kaistia algarum]
MARFRMWVATVFEREIDTGRGFLWLAVTYAAGILVYFTAPSEPSGIALAILTLALAVAAWKLRHGRAGLFRLMLVAAMAVAGATTIKLRTDHVAAPRLERQMTGTLTGFVEAREARRGGFRLTIRVVSFDARGLAALPERVTTTVRGSAPAVGEGVTLLARLRPPSGPAMPGGYDFGLPAYYGGIGGTGFAYGRVNPAELGEPPLSIRLTMPLEALREAIRTRIGASLSGDTARIATALVIGDAGGISEEGEDALRQSGLAHVLSVSGLHMVLVAGFVFWAVRAALALSPGLALRRPIKKWAALAALGVTFFYLLISGLDVAAQRSFIMTGVVFLAILVDRRAISMRNVAIGAFVVLALSPESLLVAGFQMSFAATIALVAGFEALSRRPRGLRPVSHSRFGSVLRWFGLLIGGLALTSLLGGLGTTPFALYHFQRMAPLSILANVAAMPLVDFLVMPLALLAVLAMPFGFEAPFLWVMGVGIDGMSDVARTVSDWSEGTGSAAMPSAASLLVFMAGFLWLALMRERWRLAGLVPMLVGGALALYPHRSDIIIAPDGRQVAIRTGNGSYQILARKIDPFIAGIWLRADGDSREAKDPALMAATRCDASGCVAPMPDGRLVALALERDAFADDCRSPVLIVTPIAAPTGCAAEVATIDRDRLAQSGSIALDLRPVATRNIADPPSADKVIAAATEYDSAVRHTLDDEDVPAPEPGSPQPRAGPAPLDAEFLVTTAFPRVRRPWMPPYDGDDEPETGGAGAQ